MQRGLLNNSKNILGQCVSGLIYHCLLVPATVTICCILFSYEKLLSQMRLRFHNIRLSEMER
jgi:hypothetical protein